MLINLEKSGGFLITLVFLLEMSGFEVWREKS